MDPQSADLHGNNYFVWISAVEIYQASNLKGAEGKDIDKYFGRGYGPSFADVPLGSSKNIKGKKLWADPQLQAARVVEAKLVFLEKLVGRQHGHQQIAAAIAQIAQQLQHMPGPQDEATEEEAWDHENFIQQLQDVCRP